MAFGIVKWFNNHKGFGFIESSEIDQDVFAHFSQVNMTGFKTLQQGASVMYELIEGPRGWMAQNIKVIAAPASPDEADVPSVSTRNSRSRTPQFGANLSAQRL
ncbi:MAG: cold shock domain-containing protein [Burkholderiales bacterium]|nr:cold shock domain-containing protein [Burkholderiales bacterium]